MFRGEGRASGVHVHGGVGGGGVEVPAMGRGCGILDQYYSIGVVVVV